MDSLEMLSHFSNGSRNASVSRREAHIVNFDDPILITGACGFIGFRVVENLLDRGFRNLRCFVRPISETAKLEALSRGCHDEARIEVIKGNLLSSEDCTAATKNVAVIFHLAAGRGEKSFPDAFMNSVVTTRNLLEASRRRDGLKRFLNVSSFTVYSNKQKPGWRLLDESCPIETHPELRAEAYCFAKIKQEEILTEYGKKFGIPYVIVRPGLVYGPGNEKIAGRVGMDSFGFFMHLGGSNTIPFTYVENCADAIVLAGLKRGIEGQVFNVVDDDLPSSREFLRLYKRQVRKFSSLYIPHLMSYAFCALWERYSRWSGGQLPQTFNRSRWHASWKKTHYTNEKLKTLGWTPKVATVEGLRRHFESCRETEANA